MHFITRTRVSKTACFTALILGIVMVSGCSSNNATPPAAVTLSVSSTNPIDTATAVPFNRKVTAVFSGATAPASCTTSSFTLKQGVTAVSGSVSCVDRTAVFTPTANLAASSLFTATITTGVTDLAGNALAVNKTWTFTTGTTGDATAPTVVSVTPLDTATAVAINRSATATFSEAVDPATLTATTFTLMQGATAVSGTVSSVSSVATFQPATNLAPNTVFTATITTGAKDLAGNPLASNKTWSFTTGTTAAAGPAPVLLGTAGNFVILAKSGVSTVPTSAVTGDIGVSPIDHTAVTGFSETMDASGTFSTAPQVTGKIYAADYTPPTPSYMTTAISDMQIAYTDAAGRTSPDFTELGAGEIGGLTLAPGLYKWGTGVSISTDVTLSGGANDVWIFQIAGGFTQANAAKIVLAGGAVAKNIFWQTFGTATVGTTAQFKGILLSQTGIDLGTGASVSGRLLAQTAVTLKQNAVTQPAP